MAEANVGLTQWLRTSSGATGYAAAWLVFGCGFGAVTWFARPSVYDAALNTSIVILPAALLGIGVIRISDAWPPWKERQVWRPVGHLALALAYALLWTGSVSLFGSVLRLSRSGTWTVGLPPDHVLHWHLLTGVLLYTLLAGAAAAYQQVVHSGRGRRTAEARLAGAQLNPHFLANTLHSLGSLVRSDPGKAEEAFERLNGLLQYVLRIQREELRLVRVEDEYRFLKQYLALETMVTAGHFTVETDIDEETLDMWLPPLLLQPLVENAIRHGLRPKTEGGVVRISVTTQADQLALKVSDTGVGADLTHLSTGAGLGLRAVRARVAEFCGDAGRVDVATMPGRGFSVRIELPIEDTVGPGGSRHA